MNIGILGMGLIGGSIWKGLGTEAKAATVEDMHEFDVLILAVPIPAILSLGEKIREFKRTRPLVVIDVGSVKECIAERFEAWSSERIEFVATHPMAGKEQSGFDASDGALFQGAKWVVTPHAKNREETLLEVERLIRRLGAAPIRMDAKTHDKRAARISHMPYLVSKALLALASPDDLAMAGPGFKSMTRLAKDNPILHQEIEEENGANIQTALQEFYETLRTLADR